MTDLLIISSSGDGQVTGQHAAYPTAQSTATGSGTTASSVRVGQRLLSGDYYVHRVFLEFDTSVIPAGVRILQANLKLTASADASTTDFDVQIIEQDWSAQDPLSSGTREAAYDNCLAATDYILWRNTSGLALDTTYTSANLTTSYINRSGNTYYSLRSNRDKNGDVPTGGENITVYLSEDVTEAYRPTLYISYDVLELSGDSGTYTLAGSPASLTLNPEILRTEFVCIAYWGGKEVVILTDESGNILTDGNGNILTAEQFVTGLHAATQDWLTDRRFYEGNFSTGNANEWSEGIVLASPAIAYSGNGSTAVRQNATSLELVDADLEISTSGIINLSVIIEHIALDYLADGTTHERRRRRGYTCVGWSRSKTSLTLELEDLTDELLDKTYPARIYQKDAVYMPDVLAEDVGKTVPYVVGIGTKVQCTLIKSRELLAEQVVDGDFGAGITTNWQVIGDSLWTVSDGKARKTAGGKCNLSQTLTTTKGAHYVVDFKYSCTAGYLGVVLNNAIHGEAFGMTDGEVSDAAVIWVKTKDDIPDVGLAFIASEDFAGTVDDVVVKLLSEVGGASNFIQDSGFDTDGGNWVLGSTAWQIDTGTGLAMKQSGDVATLSQAPTMLPTDAYLWTLYLDCAVPIGSFTVTLGGRTHRKTISETGSYRLNFVPITDGDLIITPSYDAQLTLDTVTLHAWQAAGSTLITDGDFASQGAWRLGDDAAWNVTDEPGRCSKPAGSAHTLSPKPAGTLLQPTVGTHYQVGLDYTRDSGFLTVALGGETYEGDQTAVGGKLTAQSASITWYVTATTTDPLEIIPSTLFSGTVDNVSVKEATPYIYSICEKSGAVSFAVNTVYKGSNQSGVIVPTTQYVVSTRDAGGFDVHTLEFNVEQLDFSGNRSSLYADVIRIAAGQNAVTEIARILTWAGLTVNSTSQTAAEAIATANNMWVDWCYGWDGQAKTIRSYLDQLLLIIRGFVYTDESHSWCFWQDVAGSPAASYDESLGDLIDVTRYAQGRRPATITLGYRPNPVSPEQPYHVLTRTIGALTGEERYDVPMIYNFTAADALHNYLANRRLYNQSAQATLAKAETVLGNILSIDNVKQWPGSKDWIVIGQSYNYDVEELELLEYTTAVYSYTAGTLPTDGEGYLPDYSATLPAAPTNIRITKNIHDERSGLSKVTCECAPPAVNYNALWFETERVDDNTLKQVEARQSGSLYTAIIDGLVPGEEYILYAFAKNQFGLIGVYSAGLEFTSAPNLIENLPVVSGLNLLNNDTPAINPVIGDLQQLLVEWTQALDKRVAGYAIEYRFDTDEYVEMARTRATNASKWIDADIHKTKTLYIRARTYDATATQFSAYCTPITYVIPDPSP